MVHLTKIYTRSGDRGTTGLGNGSRVAKTHIRVEAYGTVDEANAAIGMAVCEAESIPEIAEVLRNVQNALFDVGADLCTPVGETEQDGDKLRVTEAQTKGLETLIDRFNEDLEPLTSFVLPGGTRLAAALHVARTIVRRSERLTVGLAESEPDNVNGEAVRYLNRLSDLLFVLARWVNRSEAGGGGSGDVLWVPGKDRDA
ncbi:MAG: cob(I)yrinic acid a,c-diamide adenosyltransferase [Planctomycetota bacterium]